MADGDTDLVSNLYHNRSLHELVYRASGNPDLIGVLDVLWDRSAHYRKVQLKDSEVLRAADKQHMGIVDALSERDGQLASDPMRDNVATLAGKHPFACGECRRTPLTPRRKGHGPAHESDRRHRARQR